MLSSFGRCLDEKVGSRDSLFQVRSYQRFYVWSEEKVKTYEMLEIIYQCV